MGRASRDGLVASLTSISGRGLHSEPVTFRVPTGTNACGRSAWRWAFAGRILTIPSRHECGDDVSLPEPPRRIRHTDVAMPYAPGTTAVRESSDLRGSRTMPLCA